MMQYTLVCFFFVTLVSDTSYLVDEIPCQHDREALSVLSVSQPVAAPLQQRHHLTAAAVHISHHYQFRLRRMGVQIRDIETNDGQWYLNFQVADEEREGRETTGMRKSFRENLPYDARATRIRSYSDRMRWLSKGHFGYRYFEPGKPIASALDLVPGLVLVVYSDSTKKCRYFYSQRRCTAWYIAVTAGDEATPLCCFDCL